MENMLKSFAESQIFTHTIKLCSESYTPDPHYGVSLATSPFLFISILHLLSGWGGVRDEGVDLISAAGLGVHLHPDLSSSTVKK